MRICCAHADCLTLCKLKLEGVIAGRGRFVMVVLMPCGTH
jgi:hypothetical protein